MHKLLTLSLALLFFISGTAVACSHAEPNSAANLSETAKPATPESATPESATPESAVGALEQYRWELKAIRDKAVELVKGGDTPFLSFDKAKGSAGGNTGCNSFGGSYETEGKDKIRISDTISTMRACIEDNRMEVERGFMDGLQTTDRYELEGTSLRLYEGETLLLEFEGKDKTD